VLSIPEADHQETSPDAPLPVIARMSCSLSNKTGVVRFLSGSRLRDIVGVESRIEGYQCSYGLNTIYESALEKCGLRFSARGADGSPHAFELSTHPFFFGSLFQPERAITREECHPLILEFIKAAGTVG
jgi:CTP synthase (UTP-ammonia lyase)